MRNLRWMDGMSLKNGIESSVLREDLAGLEIIKKEDFGGLDYHGEEER